MTPDAVISTRSMEGVTKCARALDKGFRQIRVDPKWKVSLSVPGLWIRVLDK